MPKRKRRGCFRSILGWRYWPALVVTLLAALPFGVSRARAEKQRQLWVTNAYGNDVHVFDVDTLELISRIEVGPNPHGISATADGKTVHVALENFGAEEGELIWIDAPTGKILHSIKVGPRPNENECTPDGKWIYVPCDDGHYWVVDGEKQKVVTRIETGGRPHNTVVSPDGKRMYLSPMGTPKRVTIVDVDAGHKVIGEIPFDNVTRPPAISPDEKYFYQNIDGLIGFQVADIAERKVVRTVESKIADDKKDVPSRAHGLCVRPDQREIWSCNVEHNTVHVHELASGEYKEVATIAMPGRIYWVSFTPDSKYGFVSVRSNKQVAVVDCATKEIVKLLDAGTEPKRTQVIDVPQSLEIRIDKEGKIRADRSEITNDDDLLRIVKERFGDAARDAKATVRAHPEVITGELVRVIEMLHRAGITNVSIGVSREAAAASGSDDAPDEASESASER